MLSLVKTNGAKIARSIWIGMKAKEPIGSLVTYGLSW